MQRGPLRSRAACEMSVARCPSSDSKIHHSKLLEGTVSNPYKLVLCASRTPARSPRYAVSSRSFATLVLGCEPDLHRFRRRAGRHQSPDTIRYMHGSEQLNAYESKHVGLGEAAEGGLPTSRRQVRQASVISSHSHQEVCSGVAFPSVRRTLIRSAP